MADVTKKPPHEELAKPKDDKKPDDPKAKKDSKESEDLSEEDKQLQEELEMLMERLTEPDAALYQQALVQMSNLIKASTTSMTSVPKPLKFLRRHFPALKEIYEKITEDETKQFCAEVISVLAMTISDGRDCLNYKLLGIERDIGEWGHEYVRHLAGEISQDWWEIKKEDSERREKLLQLATKIIPYNLSHNAEAEACDLAMELEHLELLEKYVDEDSHQRVCQYMTSCVAYVPDPENERLLQSALKIFLKFNQWARALRVAMQLNDSNLVAEILNKCPDQAIRKQLAFMIGRQQIHVDIPNNEQQQELTDITTNSLLNTNFLALGRELDILEPKTPDEVYKSHLDGPRQTFGSQVDSARQNLAASFVSGFVNAGFGRDKLLTEDGNKWLYKNKEHGMLSATASLGLILLWDVDGGLGQIDKYLYSAEDYIKAGALLACGIVNCGVRNECDPALALLSDYVTHNSNTMRIGSILGLGLAYAGTNRDDIIELLNKVILDSNAAMEVIGLACLACGLVCVGTCNEDVTSTLLQSVLERSERTDSDLKDTHARFIALGLGLCYLGKQERAEIVIQTLEAAAEPYKSMAVTLVEVCAYAGTGNVLKIQKLLHICSEHYELAAATDSSKKDEDKRKRESKSKDKKGEADKEKAGSSSSSASKDKGKETLDLSLQQSVACLGIALIAMGEDIGTEMAFRTFGHLLRYCEPAIRRAVPLALPFYLFPTLD
ncbi:26S proteasome non-ATPase regulatory subunit 2 [Orchesella cincta]|uniref:26S proteasome non-ATPase regulatory subunit 2 n=1 Tax=Orchesella cincta TaxID=48709 RepID=A0A1D2NKD3_ORCCI|nr:26S proteasome non-ATPase regulatory subunit 2 [Orchesella cincta]